MTPELLIALAGFAFATSITPGPNNLMLMASGANFGFRRSIPHMLGISIGFVLLAVVTGAGLARAFEAMPLLRAALTVAGTLYMLWLAWRIAGAAPPDAAAPAGEPLSFVQAAAFQWVNPKAWGMAITAVTVYAPDDSLASIALVAAFFGLVNLPSVGTWTILGLHLRRLLSSPRRLRAFNRTMALLLVASLWPVLAP